MKAGVSLCPLNNFSTFVRGVSSATSGRRQGSLDVPIKGARVSRASFSNRIVGCLDFLMKKIPVYFLSFAFSFVVLSGVLVLLGTQAPQQAAGPSFAFASDGFILSQLPEAKQVDANIRAYEKQLKTRMDAKIEEFQRKNKDYQSNYESMSDVELADAQEELGSLQQRLIEFEKEATQSVQKRQQDQLRPVIEKVQNAIDKVAKTKGYDYIIKADALLYAKPEKDISMDVLKSLGVDTSKIKAPSKTGK